ncbi:MAG TPA: ammonium transporter [Acidimicrobiales bacterium]|nr:ammonium transporter [Acidimicrobiales bacterium]
MLATALHTAASCAFNPDVTSTVKGCAPTVDQGDNAWILASSALVLFMTPGLAFFYAGMVRRKNVLGMIMQNWVVMGLVGVVWVLVTYSLAFGVDAGGIGFVGTFHFAGLLNIDSQPVPGESLTISPIVFVVFQMMFAVITPALITGTTADRLKFGAYCTFIVLWSIVVYAPVAHWVFSPTGWLFQRTAEDFAGGTVVHINAAMGGLGLLLVLKNRRGWPGSPMKPHNVPFTVLGAGILWFGWFGFNAGSALAANNLSAHAFLNTNTATAAALLGWIACEKVKNGKSTTLGGASGAVAGLVAITPSCGYVNLLGALVIGLVAGVACCLACGLKFRFNRDDALDVLGVHFVGGVLGAVLIGFFGTNSFNSAARNGLFYGGGVGLLGEQCLGVICVAGYSLVVSYLLAKGIDMTMGLRVSEEEEEVGLDLTQHEETAYDFDSVLSGVRSALTGGEPISPFARPTAGAGATTPLGGDA